MNISLIRIGFNGIFLLTLIRKISFHLILNRVRWIYYFSFTFIYFLVLNLSNLKTISFKNLIIYLEIWWIFVINWYRWFWNGLSLSAVKILLDLRAIASKIVIAWWESSSSLIQLTKKRAWLFDWRQILIYLWLNI